MVVEASKHRVLIVDDEESLRTLFTRFLEVEGFVCDTAADGEEALSRLEEEEFSLVITDINMPGMGGLELLRESTRRYRDLVVIMISAIDDRKVAVEAMELGAFAYMIKPVTRNELVINVFNALRWRFLEQSHRQRNETLEQLVRQRTETLEKTQGELARATEEILLRLAKAAEFRDDETAQHTLRMSHYCAIIARGIGMDDQQCELIRLASQLHDVGKIGIPDAILFKPGRLTSEEFDIMKEHARFGYRILSDSKAELLKTGAIIALGHHEKFDGSGYPDGLVGEDIPLEARIAAVADVFDALTTRRVYKDAMPVEQAIDILRQGAGTHFDPRLTAVFFDSMEEVMRVRKQFRNPDE